MKMAEPTGKIVARPMVARACGCGCGRRVKSRPREGGCGPCSITTRSANTVSETVMPHKVVTILTVRPGMADEELRRAADALSHLRTCSGFSAYEALQTAANVV